MAQSQEQEIHLRLRELYPDSHEELLAPYDLGRLSDYYEFLQTTNEIGGFFSKRDSEQILDRHLIDCMWYIHTLAKKDYLRSHSQIADFGTGPGLPGYLLACRIEPLVITLIDSQSRRLKFLESFVNEKQYKNLHFVYKRAEETTATFDLAVSRSFLPYPWSAELVYRSLKVGGIYAPFLGKLQEWPREKFLLNQLGYDVLETVSIPELEFLGERHIKFLKRARSTKDGYPRVWKEIQKEIKKENG